tara:strand:- start:675 stop:887 length:213 start_codon:yes stop_codon:yes gene_type:complete
MYPSQLFYFGTVNVHYHSITGYVFNSGIKKEFDGVAELFENVARLWAYGDGANTIGYDAIQRQLRPAQTA